MQSITASLVSDTSGPGHHGVNFGANIATVCVFCSPAKVAFALVHPVANILTRPVDSVTTTFLGPQAMVVRLTHWLILADDGIYVVMIGLACARVPSKLGDALRIDRAARGPGDSLTVTGFTTDAEVGLCACMDAIAGVVGFTTALDCAGTCVGTHAILS